MQRIITKFNQTCITCWNGKMTLFGKEPTIFLRNHLFTYSWLFLIKTSCLFTMAVLSVCTWSYADLFMRWSEERIRLFSSYIQVAYLDFFFQFFLFSNAGEGAIQKNSKNRPGGGNTSLSFLDFQALYDEGRAHQENVDLINDLGGQIIQKVLLLKTHKHETLLCFVCI